MFFAEEDLTLHITRGDAGEITVTAVDEKTDGSDAPYIFKAGEVLRLKVYEKKNCSNVVLQKDYPVVKDTETVTLALTETDTKIGDTISKPVDYWYEIELNPFTEPQTIVGYDDDGAKVLRLYPEGLDEEYIPPTEEELGTVDKELDMTSERAIQNQAVARAIVKLEATVEKNNETATTSATATNKKVATLEEEIAVERARITNLATLREGSTTGDAELLDARVGYKGKVYNSVGDAIRSQVADANDDIKGIENALEGVTYLKLLNNELIIEVGALNGTTGAIVTATTTGNCTQPFEVEEGEVYYISGAINKIYCLYALYDANKQLITTYGLTAEASTTKISNEMVTIPATATDKNGVEKAVRYMACSTLRNNANSGLDLAVKKEVIEYKNIVTVVKDSTEELSVEKMDKVLVSPNGTEWALTISNDGTIKAIKRYNNNDDVIATITTPSGLAVGTYILKYEGVSGVLSGYTEIGRFDITADGTPTVYNGFIAENCSPKNATGIAVYNTDGLRVGGIPLNFLQKDYGEKLYSFGAISDVHIGQADSVEDFTNAIEYFGNEDDVQFVTICGDMVDNSSITTQLETYQSIVKTAPKPVYVVAGNHEALNYKSGENYDNIKGYFAQDNHPNINQDLYYTFTHNDDVFIMCGVYGSYNLNETFSLTQLQWLYETLEENRNKRCFLFLHYFPQGGSGDAVKCYDADGLKGSRGEVFYSLMKHYKNVIYFHGHSHAKFKVQELNNMNTIDNIFGRYSINIPSLTWPTYPNATMNAYSKDSLAGEGYIVDVHEHGILLKGRDFEKNEFSPLGTYYLDTVIQRIEANTYKDTTGVICTPVK